MNGGRPGGLAGDRSAEAACIALLVVALLFGGGSRGSGDLVVHLAAAPALLLAAMRWPAHAASRWQRAFVAWWLLAIGLVLAQLVPLPPDLWSALGPRASVAADLQAAGIAPQWRPLTLDRWGTVRALLALLVFGAMWMLASTLRPEARRRLLLWALAVGAVLALLGLAQAAAGQHAPLRFHTAHDATGATGTFANRNHFADLMAMLAPLSLAFGWQAQQQSRTPLAMAMHALGVLLLLAAALSFSRGGSALAAFAFIAILLALVQSAHGSRRWLAPVASVAAIGCATAVYAWDGLARRFAQDPVDDLRWQYLHYGLNAARNQLPWGSGLGSFKWSYAPFEPISAMGHTHALHAHNDLLEIAVEAGVPGLLLAAAFVALLALAAGKNLMDRRRGPVLNAALVVAATVPLLHSLLDYPLRTLAVATLFSLVVAQLTTTHFSPEQSR